MLRCPRSRTIRSIRVDTHLDCHGLVAEHGPVDLAKATLPHLCQGVESSRGHSDLLGSYVSWGASSAPMPHSCVCV